MSNKIILTLKEETTIEANSIKTVNFTYTMNSAMIPYNLGILKMPKRLTPNIHAPNKEEFKFIKLAARYIDLNLYQSSFNALKKMSFTFYIPLVNTFSKDITLPLGMCININSIEGIY